MTQSLTGLKWVEWRRRGREQEDLPREDSAQLLSPTRAHACTELTSSCAARWVAIRLAHRLASQIEREFRTAAISTLYTCLCLAQRPAGCRKTCLAVARRREPCQTRNTWLAALRWNQARPDLAISFTPSSPSSTLLFALFLLLLVAAATHSLLPPTSTGKMVRR